jgi:CRP/FNR family transcriptional regulator, polysaccharide utilization system transcription regulator
MTNKIATSLFSKSNNNKKNSMPKALHKKFSNDELEPNAFIASSKGINDLKDLPKNHKVKAFRKRDNIYTETSYPRGIYFISKGQVKTYKIQDQGKEFITGVYKEGDFFGYITLLEEEYYNDSAMALEDSEICLIPKEDFFSFVCKNPDISRMFIKIIANTLKEKEEQLIKLAYDSVRKRVADALITLSNIYKKNENEQLSISISREDLSSFVGIAQETTIRTLSDFKQEGLVDIKIRGGAIAVTQYNRLVQMRN